LRTPIWLLGAGLVVVATAMNVLALAMAPVALVQPLGALSLVCAAIISTRTSGLRLRGPLLLGITTCVMGVFAFVGGSATVTRNGGLDDEAAWKLIGLLVCAAVGACAVLATHAGHTARVASSGFLFGMVAVSVHAVAPIIGEGLLGLPLSGPAGESRPGLTVTMVLMLLVGVVAALGTWLVQTSYESGPPETVLAGLTVLDPLFAVLVGAVVLHEYSLPTPGMTVLLVVSALTAVSGIVTVVRHHPGVVDHRPENTTTRHRSDDDHDPAGRRAMGLIAQTNQHRHGQAPQRARG
jgi:drug/metabolite transporter (DMT)-like permease